MAQLLRHWTTTLPPSHNPLLGKMDETKWCNLASPMPFPTTGTSCRTRPQRFLSPCPVHMSKKICPRGLYRKGASNDDAKAFRHSKMVGYHRSRSTSRSPMARRVTLTSPPLPSPHPPSSFGEGECMAPALALAPQITSKMGGGEKSVD